jgi:hypothetical protein
MPKANAECQQAWRQRRVRCITALEAEAAELRTEADVLRADLAAALAEAERLATAACGHPLAQSTAAPAGHAEQKSGSRTLHMQGRSARRLAPPDQRPSAAGLPLAQFVSA